MIGLNETRCALMAALLGATLLSGCGGSAALKNRVTDLEKQLLKVENDYDRLEERLQAVEAERQLAARAAAERRNPDDLIEREPLKVVRLAPEVEAPPAAPPRPAAEPEGERPVIRGSGDKVYSTEDTATKEREK